jgi:hypothetical protein
MSSKYGETEAALYEPVKEYLISRFKTKFGGECYLETTANGTFTEAIKKHIADNIIFSFLRKASPDLTGYTWRKESVLPTPPLSSLITYDVKDLITVEIKKERITPQDIYQAKMYGDLFQAKYAFLISPQPIPEEIRRLDKNLFLTNRFMSGWVLHIGQWITDGAHNAINKWLPRSPFPD